MIGTDTELIRGTSVDLETMSEFQMQNPWTETMKPFHVIENVYFVGTKFVSVFLIRTPDGLVLIDCGYQEVFYLLLDSIYQLGFDPHDVKLLLLTHGHYDHCGAARALQELSGCRIFLGKEDAFFFTDRRDLIHHEDHVGLFEISHYYDPDVPVSFGGMTFLTIPCPGHTPGTYCIFFDVKHKGRIITLGIHGGLGTNGLTKKELEENGLPVVLQQKYLQNLKALSHRHVDVVLPSHVLHTVNYPFYQLADQNDGSGNVFIDPGAWRRMLEKKIKDMEKIIERDAELPITP